MPEHLQSGSSSGTVVCEDRDPGGCGSRGTFCLCASRSSVVRGPGLTGQPWDPAVSSLLDVFKNSPLDPIWIETKLKEAKQTRFPAEWKCWAVDRASL